MKEEFNSEEAKKFLLEKEETEKNQKEDERKLILQKIIAILQIEFKESIVEQNVRAFSLL